MNDGLLKYYHSIFKASRLSVEYLHNPIFPFYLKQHDECCIWFTVALIPCVFSFLLQRAFSCEVNSKFYRLLSESCRANGRKERSEDTKGTVSEHSVLFVFDIREFSSSLNITFYRDSYNRTPLRKKVP